MEEKTFVGYGYGVFNTDNGGTQAYCNVFMLEDFAGEQNDNYHFEGLKAAKYKCTGTDVFKGIKVGAKVNVFFDSKGKVCYMKAV